MLIYIFLFIFVFFFGLAGLIKKQEYVHIFLFVCLFMILWLFCGFRDKVGPDWTNYAGSFSLEIPLSDILNLSAVSYTLLEPLFLLLCWIVKSLHGNINTLYIVITFLSVWLIFKRLKYINCFPLIGALIFVAHGYFLLFSQIRQGLAVSIFFYSITYIYEKKLLQYTLCILLAMGFHLSAIILFPLYFIVRSNFNHIKVLGILILAIVFQQLHVLTFILKILVQVTGNPILHKYYDLYIVREMFSGYARISTLMVEWVGWVILLTVYKYKLSQLLPFFNTFYNICWIGLAVYIVFSDIYVFARIALYFRLSFLVLLPSLFCIMREISFKIAFYLIISSVVFIRWYTPIKTDRSGTVAVPNSFIPYKTILF